MLVADGAWRLPVPACVLLLLPTSACALPYRSFPALPPTGRIEVDDKANRVLVQFTPTIPHCSMATLIGLSIRVRLLRALPERFKVCLPLHPPPFARWRLHLLPLPGVVSSACLSLRCLRFAWRGFGWCWPALALLFFALICLGSLPRFELVALLNRVVSPRLILDGFE